MGTYNMGEALQQFLDKSKLKGNIQALQIKEWWEINMGKTIAKYTENIQIFGDKLIITTPVAPLKQELLFQKEKIKQRVNEALKTNQIKEVIIK